MGMVTRGLFLALALVAAVLGGGCSGSEDFDPNDVILRDSFAGMQGAELVWGATVVNGSSKDVEIELQLSLRLGAEAPFYTSPRHREIIDKGDTGTFIYREAGVTVPPGAVSYTVAVSGQAR